MKKMTTMAYTRVSMRIILKRNERRPSKVRSFRKIYRGMMEVTSPIFPFRSNDSRYTLKGALN
jgi:hypothetical protein